MGTFRFLTFFFLSLSPTVFGPPSSQYASALLLPALWWEWSLWQTERHYTSLRKQPAESWWWLHPQGPVWAGVLRAGPRGGSILSGVQHPPPSLAYLWGSSEWETTWAKPTSRTLRFQDNISTTKELGFKGSLGKHTPRWARAAL